MVHDTAGAVFDGFHEECGVVGIYGHPEAANLAYLALYSLQHRGQESAGITSSNGQGLAAHAANIVTRPYHLTFTSVPLHALYTPSGPK